MRNILDAVFNNESNIPCCPQCGDVEMACYCAEWAPIGDDKPPMFEWEMNVAGTSYRKEYARKVKKHTVASFEREPDNKFDSNAIKVIINKEHVGYVPANVAVSLAQFMDNGGKATAVVTYSAAQADPKKVGIVLQCATEDEVSDEVEAACGRAKVAWQAKASMYPKDA